MMLLEGYAAMPALEGATLRTCFRDPIPEIADAARYLDAAVAAHLAERSDIAEELIRIADMSLIREWTESIWGKGSPYVQWHSLPESQHRSSRDVRVKLRMPTLAEKQRLHLRDGYHCRFCGIPVVRMEVRKRMMKWFPVALRWGQRNVDQHAAFQAMWAQYDHLLPHSRGGTNDLDNLVVTCAPCNFGRMEYTLEEVGLADPRLRQPIRSGWNGLERFP